MDILSKDLDNAARTDVFNTHPQCVDHLITHLRFVNDILIFFDGTAESLRGIIKVLRNFQSKLDLALNIHKTCVFIDGSEEAYVSLALDFGLVRGSLPVQYLGLPLSTHKLHKQDYQLLTIDKIKLRITS